MNITVVGLGYVGLSLSVLLSTKYNVVAYDIDKLKIKLINDKKSPFKDMYIEDYLVNKKLNLIVTSSSKEAFKNCNYLIICTPTNYDEVINFFDTSSVESVIDEALKFNKKLTIIIKSTVPIGYTRMIKQKFHYDNIIFIPEFLREGKALYDNLYPSRIIIGGSSNCAHEFAEILKNCVLKKDVDVKFMGSTEAEAVKLFSNAYLALRVSYFNELDTYAELNGLNTRDIIDGVCMDPRIGSYYNNPSFGYGGYCLPKDTKQLLANYKEVPQNLISAIVSSNDTRKKYIVDTILSKNAKTIGIYRLIMKSGSDNFRNSSIIDIIDILSRKNVSVIIYEPTLNISNFLKYDIINDISLFKKKSDIIVANRFEKELEDVIDKVYSRDIFKTD